MPEEKKTTITESDIPPVLDRTGIEHDRPKDQDRGKDNFPVKIKTIPRSNEVAEIVPLPSTEGITKGESDKGDRERKRLGMIRTDI